MKKLTSLLAAGTIAACAAVAFAQDKPAAKPAATPAPAAKPATAPAAKPGDKPAAPMGMTEEQMQKMMAAATPGEFHKKLEAFTGKWNYTMKMWPAPDQTPEESSGTAEFKPMMDGRFMQQTITGTMDMGGGPMPFHGFGLTGYDNVTKKYWNTWVDSMGTGAMTSTGTVDATGKTFSYNGTYECPVFGQCSAVYTLKWVDANSFKMEFNSTSKSGPPCKMELTYTRAK